jgi:6-phosphogluconolactonase (cycloisomerase 2 family)
MCKYIRRTILSVISFLFIISTCYASDVNQTNVLVQQSRYAYGLMNDPEHDIGYINLYSVAVDGSLTFQSSIKVGQLPMGIAFSDNGSYAYELDYYSSVISVFGVSSGTGELTLLQEVNPPSNYVSSIVQRGGYIYVTTAGNNNDSGHVYTYSIDKNDGMLTFRSSVKTGVSPLDLTFSANGKYAYVSNYVDSTVSMYNASPKTGELTPLNPQTVPTGGLPSKLTFDPNGTYVYVVIFGRDHTNGSVSTYSFRPTDGQLTFVSTVSTGVGPDAIAFSLDGKYAYVTNYDTPATLSSYSVVSAGGLSPLPTMGLETSPTDIVFDPSGKYVYVSSYFGITKYSFSATGKLTEPQYISTGYKALSLNFSPNNSVGE